MRKSEITLDTVIQQNREILASNLDGEKVMMSIQHGEYYGLGKAGTFIWDQIEKPVKIADLIYRITEKYNIDKEQCFKDISSFIKDLIEKELIIVTY
ncbi:lasso peptide biosynthesis PqqD family chaperone [Bacteroidota bacterium]